MMITSSDYVETNKLLMQCIDFDKELFNEKTLSTSEEEYFNSFIDGFNRQLSLFSKWLESDEARELFGHNLEYNDIVFESIRDDLEEIVHDTNLSAEEIIERIYDTGLDHGYKEIRRTKYYNDATKYGLKLLQGYNFDLIQNLNDDIIEHIRTQIFLGITAGESMPEVMRRILHAHEESLTGKTLTARQRAMMIARTETARAMTQGRLQSYANYGVEKIKILTAGDTNVCPICLEAAYTFNGEMHIDNVAGERIWKITEANKLVPFHPNCRCSVMAYIEHVLGPNPVENPNVVNLTPLEKLPDESANGLASVLNQKPDIYDEKYEHLAVNMSMLNMHVTTYDFGELKLSFTADSQLTYDDVVNHLRSLPQKFKDTHSKRIVISNQVVRGLGGDYSPMTNDINIYHHDKKEDLLHCLTHELAHSIDVSRDNKNNVVRAYSDPEIYEEIFKADNKANAYISATGKKRTPKVFPTDYAGRNWLKDKRKKTEFGKSKRFEEDFADSTKLYLDPDEHDDFVKKFPNRAEYLKGIYGEVSF